VVIRREDAERFVEDIHSDDLELANTNGDRTVRTLRRSNTVMLHAMPSSSTAYCPPVTLSAHRDELEHVRDSGQKRRGLRD
jgi:hypothetical protein